MSFDPADSTSNWSPNQSFADILIARFSRRALLMGGLLAAGGSLLGPAMQRGRTLVSAQGALLGFAGVPIATSDTVVVPPAAIPGTPRRAARPGCGFSKGGPSTWRVSPPTVRGSGWSSRTARTVSTREPGFPPKRRSWSMCGVPPTGSAPPRWIGPNGSPCIRSRGRRIAPSPTTSTAARRARRVSTLPTHVPTTSSVISSAGERRMPMPRPPALSGTCLFSPAMPPRRTRTSEATSGATCSGLPTVSGSMAAESCGSRLTSPQPCSTRATTRAWATIRCWRPIPPPARFDAF
jgi:hypothetical protein